MQRHNHARTGLVLVLYTYVRPIINFEGQRIAYGSDGQSACTYVWSYGVPVPIQNMAPVILKVCFLGLDHVRLALNENNIIYRWTFS